MTARHVHTHATPGERRAVDTNVTPPGHPGAEEDRIPTLQVLSVGIGALVVFFLASLVTVSYFRMRQGEHGPLPVPPEIGQSKIGMVEQQMFDVAFRGERDRAARLQHLQGYGWIDRQAGVVYLPIDRAMQLVVEGVRPPQTPQLIPPEATPPGGQP